MNQTKGIKIMRKLLILLMLCGCSKPVYYECKITDKNIILINGLTKRLKVYPKYKFLYLIKEDRILLYSRNSLSMPYNWHRLANGCIDK